MKCILGFLFSNKLQKGPWLSAALMILQLPWSSIAILCRQRVHILLFAIGQISLACERAVAEVKIVPWPALLESLTYSSNYALKYSFGSMFGSRSYLQVHSLARKASLIWNWSLKSFPTYITLYNSIMSLYFQRMFSSVLCPFYLCFFYLFPFSLKASPSFGLLS